MTTRVKCHAWHKNKINMRIVGKRLTIRLQQMQHAFFQIPSTIVSTQFHCLSIYHLWQQYSLTCYYQVVNQIVGIHLVRQGIIGHNSLCILYPIFQTGNNGKRQFFQLLPGELSLDLAHLLPQLLLTHEPLS